MGFFKGVLRGGLLSLAVAAVVSVIAESPRPPDVSDDVPGSGGLGTAVSPGFSELDSGAGRDRVPVTGAKAPETPTPRPDTLESVARSDTLPAEPPETGSPIGLAGPEPTGDVAALAPPPSDAPVLPGPISPVTPGEKGDTRPAIATEPATPAAPDTRVDPALAADPEQPGLPSAEQPPAPEISSTTPTAPGAPAIPLVDAQEPAEAPQVALATPEAPQAPAGVGASVAVPGVRQDSPATGATAAAPMALTEGADVPPAGGETVAAPQISAPRDGDADANTEVAQDGATDGLGGAADPAPEDGSDRADTTPDAATDAASESTPVPPEPSPGTPQLLGTLGDRAEGVTVNRLPSLSAPAPGEDAAPPVAEAETGGETMATDLPPLMQFAEPFENPEGKPLMAIVLMDDGTIPQDPPIGVEALGRFPYPVSFAVDATLPDAAERMRSYRERGFEVLALVDLPEGATAQDAEVSVAAALAAEPESVALLEGPTTGMQVSRDASNQVTAILAQTGHGLVTQNQGLNTVQKLAVKAGVPAVAVFRDFDSKDQTPTVIRRFLDQAAFRAGQEGAVVMLGRLRPDTISALLLWGLEDRAEKVALAPISAVLLQSR